MKKFGLLLMALMCWVPSVMAQFFVIFPAPRPKMPQPKVKIIEQDGMRFVRSNYHELLRLDNLKYVYVGLEYVTQDSLSQWFLTMASKSELKEDTRLTVKTDDDEKLKLTPDPGVFDIPAWGKKSKTYYLRFALDDEQLRMLTVSELSTVRLNMYEVPIDDNDTGRWLARCKKKIKQKM